jgi:hypothetical protein
MNTGGFNSSSINGQSKDFSVRLIVSALAMASAVATGRALHYASVSPTAAASITGGIGKVRARIIATVVPRAITGVIGKIRGLLRVNAVAHGSVFLIDGKLRLIMTLTSVAQVATKSKVVLKLITHSANRASAVVVAKVRKKVVSNFVASAELATNGQVLKAVMVSASVQAECVILPKHFVLVSSVLNISALASVSANPRAIRRLRFDRPAIAEHQFVVEPEQFTFEVTT